MSILAWRVHTLWREHLTAAAERLNVDQDSRAEMWDLDAAGWYARWRRALRHPLSDGHATSWPMTHLRAQARAAPTRAARTATAPPS